MTFDRCLMGRTHFGEMAMGGVAFYRRREAGKLETGKRTKNERQKNERHPNISKKSFFMMINAQHSPKSKILR